MRERGVTGEKDKEGEQERGVAGEKDKEGGKNEEKRRD